MSKLELKDGSSPEMAARQIEPALPGVESVTLTTGFACAIAPGEANAGQATAPTIPAKTPRRDNKPLRRNTWRPVAALNMKLSFERLVALFRRDELAAHEMKPADTVRRRRATRGYFYRP
jgi:hypothetical protein